MVLDYKNSGNGHVSTHTLEMGMWSTHRAGMRARSRERWAIMPHVTIVWRRQTCYSVQHWWNYTVGMGMWSTHTE